MAIAFPFVEVSVDDSDLQPEARRAPGVLAVVGSTNGAGSAAANDPVVIDALADATARFNRVDGDGAPNPETPLYRALAAVFQQDPRPSKVYAVKLDGDNDWAAAFRALEAADDITFVTVADAVIQGGEGDPLAPITALKAHCDNQSAAGNKRIGVAAVDPAIGRSDAYAETVTGLAAPLKTSGSRMAVVAARGAVDPSGNTAQVAAAAASAIAGQPVAASIVLKSVTGFTMPLAGQYSPGEIKALSQDGIIPVIDPALIVGEGLHFAEGTMYDAQPTYIDTVRLLDDVEFRLKAGLIGMIGDARITRAGLAAVIRKANGILGVVQRDGGITGSSIIIPVYDALLKPAAARTAAEDQIIATARAQRLVDMTVIIVLGPAIHRLSITLQPRF
ncbi:hypothetical protein C882_1771 [Caenispirillum salinarum AK4]|uniref:Uncharacterized protein n=1 Tax=Caenispirillum salinarum AK4 TaxID=1238182 RepID=K9GRB2_9PROT|nr:hypothetical protein [Caenispirillum salinarum]EKV27269.1 hypothetical protein C882_1771 [Caenispirillum salinarum AK4]